MTVFTVFFIFLRKEENGSLKKTMQLKYSSSLTELLEVNPSFDKAKLRIAYTGRNRNGTFISKTAFEDAIPSMYNCPVVANYSVEKDEIGSHDGAFVDTPDGLRYINLTEPVGLVPQDANWEWETIEDDGVIRQYLVTEVLLWKRQAGYQKIKDDGIVSQSMEIVVCDGEMQDDYYKIDSFYFTAFCLLGTAEPCFEDAALLTFDTNQQVQFQQQMTQMYEDFKLAFANDMQAQSKEENNSNMDKLNTLLETYGLTEEELSFEYKELSDEELEAKFAEIYGQAPTEPEKEIGFTLNSQLVGELRDIIRNLGTIETDWGSYPKYYFVDFDVDTQEVYFEDGDDWKLYGAPFLMDGDMVTVDIENMKRKKYAIVDFIEGKTELNNYGLREYCEQVIEATKAKSKKEYDALNDKYQALVKTIDDQEKNELFEKFQSKLGDSAEFIALREKANEYSVVELEQQLYAIIGKKQFNLNNPSAKSPKAPIIPTSFKEESEPYGDLFNFMKN